MTLRADGLEACRESPPCGSPVLDRRAHRRWHEFVRGNDASPEPRFVGLSPAENDEALAALRDEGLEREG